MREYKNKSICYYRKTALRLVVRPTSAVMTAGPASKSKESESDNNKVVAESPRHLDGREEVLASDSN